MEVFKVFHLPIHTDNRFSLIELGIEKYVPFVVQRVYAIIDGKLPSGSHCHKIEEEVFFVVRGSCVAQIDDGFGMKDVPLKQGDAMYVPPLVWHHFETWGAGTVVVALSSTPYNPKREDYITDYEQFRAQVSQVKP